MAPASDATAPAAAPVVKTFADFNVDPRVCEALAGRGIVNPFPIQELTLPLAVAGADIIGQARTGTGKTLAFGIPLIQRALPGKNPRPVSLVIVPTRELCLQVRDDLAAAAANTDVAVVAVYGGKSIEAQVEQLGQGSDIVVGTPGRLLDLLRRGSLDLAGVTGLVLDEADEMLDLGFLPDVEQLIQATAQQRQTLLFSATMPSAVVGLARRYMNKPTFMRADVEEVRIAPDTQQHFFSCHRMDKPAVLARILQSPGRGLCVVFSRTKRMADVLVEELRGQGVNAAAIHSDLRQEARERALKNFRSGKTDVLVATEVAARGLDITDVTHVVNYDCPDDEKMYLHRIGRTGRAGAAGVAITLAVWNELARLEMIKKTLGITDETHEVFSTSPILEELFDLPPHIKGGRAADVEVDEDEDAPEATAADTAEEAPARPAKRRRNQRRRAPAQRTPDRAAEADGEASAPTDEVDATDAGDGAAPAGGQAVVRRTRTRKRAVEGRPGDRGEDGAARTDDAVAAAPDDQADVDANATGSEAEPTAPTRTRQPARNRNRRVQQRGRTPRRTSQSGAPRRQDVDASAARGSGRPRLDRPLVISYLP